MEQRNGMLLFACIWSFVLVWFSPAMIGGEYRQLQSRNWTAEENGQVVSCEKKSGFVEIRVRYVVDGNAYETNRLRFASITSDPWAKEFVRQHPANSQITVYYDPRNPAEAVILQGLRGFDYTVMLFVSPFVLIGVMLWVMVLRTRRKRSGFAGLQIEQDASHVRLRPDAVYIFYTIVGVLGLAALAAYIAVLTSAGDDEPSTRGALWGCVFTIAAGAAAGGIAAWQINSGRRDMVINNVVRTFRMPGGREIGYPDLKAIRIEVKVYRGRRSDSVSKIYFVWVDYIYQDVYRAKMLGHWDDFDEAQIFARWLGEKTDTPVKDREAALT